MALSVLHAWPQAPQLLASVLGFEQAALQHCVLAPVQAMPQPLQLSGSLFTLVQCLLQQVAPAAEPQSLSTVQFSHVCVAGSQTPRPASSLGQSLSPLQPGTQAAPLQYWPVGQSSGEVEQTAPERSSPPSGAGSIVRQRLFQSLAAGRVAGVQQRRHQTHAAEESNVRREFWWRQNQLRGSNALIHALGVPHHVLGQRFKCGEDP